MGRGIGLAVATLALALSACGGEEPELPTFGGTDEEQIAATVNAMFAAIEAGDGETACGLMSERGQRIWVKIVRRNPEIGGSGETCVETVESITADPAQRGVRVDAKSVEVAPGGDTAQVTNRYGGTLTATFVDDRWLVEVPTFVN